MATRWWVASSDGVWNDTANWSTSEGGASGASVPVAGDNAYFSDTSSTYKCTLNRNEACTNISSDSSVTGGTDNWDGGIDYGTYTLAVSNDAEFAGVSGLTLTIGSSSGNGLDVGNDLTITDTNVSLDMQTDSVIRCAGDANFGDNGGLFATTDRGHFIKNGTGTYRQQRFENSWHNFTIDAGVTMSFTGSSAYVTWTNCSGTLTINGTLDIGSYNQLLGFSSGALVIGTNGDITGDGTIRYSAVTSGSSVTNNNSSPLSFTGEIVVLRYSTSDPTYVPSNLNMPDADIVLTSSSSGTKTFYFQSGTVVCDNFYCENEDSDDPQVIDFSEGDPDLEIAGNVDFKTGSSPENPSVTAGTGTITLTGAGSGTQTLDFIGQSLGPIVVDDSGATKQMVNTDALFNSLTVTAGTFDLSTRNISTNDVEIDGGTIEIDSSTGTGLNCASLTAAAGSTITLASGAKIECQYEIDIDSGATVTDSGSTITLDGSAGSQEINFGGKTIGDLVINCTGATKRLTGNVTCVDFSNVSAGIIDIQANTVTISGDVDLGSGSFTYSAGSSIVLTGSSKTFSGNTSSRSDVGDVTINAGASYTFDTDLEMSDFSCAGEATLDPTKTYIVDNPSGAGTLHTSSPGTEAVIYYNGVNSFTGTLDEVRLVEVAKGPHIVVQQPLSKQLKVRLF